jgi:hypothetical protein
VAAAPFLFQVFFDKSLIPSDANTGDLSAYVEVSPGAVTMIASGQNKDKAELDQAQRIATDAAFEAIGVEREGEGSVAQIGELPQEIRDRATTLQKIGVRVWVVGAGRLTPQ